MSKQFWHRAASYQESVLIVDLVDDRFFLRRFEDGTGHTISAEYAKAKKYWSKDKSDVLRFSDEKFKNFWSEGFEKLSKLVESSANIQLLVNCVYFLPTAPDGINGAQQTQMMNKYLENRYDLFRSRFGDDALIEYPDTLLATDAGHKWGLAPYHYSEDAYRHFVEQVRQRI
ncbi:hypothetical protein KCG45_04630 [Erythrobacter sp. WH131]|uniref:Uncharacterized protein n=2 Tax=Erythrobacter ani TaxID=2827235 RepID=A0ABS6SKE0_9SPHN|nr:hypothetical protein [Erythrobacter ani]